MTTRTSLAGVRADISEASGFAARSRVQREICYCSARRGGEGTARRTVAGVRQNGVTTAHGCTPGSHILHTHSVTAHHALHTISLGTISWQFIKTLSSCKYVNERGKIKHRIKRQTSRRYTIFEFLAIHASTNELGERELFVSGILLLVQSFTGGL